MPLVPLAAVCSALFAVPLQVTQQGRILESTGAAVTGVHNATFGFTTPPPLEASLDRDLGD